MTQIEDFRIGLRQRVIDNSEVSALISDRFYPSELAEILYPTFPCANFAIDSGSWEPDAIGILSWIPFRIWAWSKKSKDKVFKIYGKIFDAIDREIFDYSSIRIYCKEIRRPTEAYDPVNKTYYTFASWEARLMKK